MSAQKKSPKTNGAGASGGARAPTFPVLQRWLPGRLGLSIEEIRARRAQFLQEGVHWRKDGNAIVYSEAALVLLGRSVGVATAGGQKEAGRVIALGDGATPLEPRGLLAAPPSLRVWRSAPHIRNRHIVEVYIDGTHPEDRQNIELLWVKDHAGFKPGMLIRPGEYEPRPGESGQYNYVGRQPRI